MNSRLLGRVMVGAVLGTLALLGHAPGAALADTGAPEEDQRTGRIQTEPKGVKAGQKFKIKLVCPDPVAKPWVSSKITGKVSLKPLVNERADAERTAPLPTDGERTTPLLPDLEGEQPGGEPDQSDDLLGNLELDLDRAGVDAGAEANGGAGAQDDASGTTYVGWATVRAKTKAGHYLVQGSCGSTGKIVVLPNGAVSGGDGGRTGADPGRTAAGVGLLGMAMIGGVMLVRRRADGPVG